MFADGSNGSVEFLGDRIVIRRKGLANMLTQGVQGDKTIPLSSITAIQFRPAGKLMAGLIQFTLVGGREFRGGMLEATKDENAVMFTDAQQPTFEQLRDCVQAQMGSKQQAPAPSASSVGDLVQLADLLERGHITKEEFEASKARILTMSTPAAPTGSPPKAVDNNYAKPTSANVSSAQPKREPGLATKGCFWIFVAICVAMIIAALAGQVALAK